MSEFPAVVKRKTACGSQKLSNSLVKTLVIEMDYEYFFFLQFSEMQDKTAHKVIQGKLYMNHPKIHILPVEFS